MITNNRNCTGRKLTMFVEQLSSQHHSCLLLKIYPKLLLAKQINFHIFKYVVKL